MENERREKEQICPLTRPATVRGARDGRPCLKDGCAWWSNQLEACAIAATVAVWIESLRRKLVW